MSERSESECELPRPVDGGTVGGFTIPTPLPPDPAYAQIWWGVPLKEAKAFHDLNVGKYLGISLERRIRYLLMADFANFVAETKVRTLLNQQIGAFEEQRKVMDEYNAEFRAEREARERAEKALRELLEHVQRNWQCKPSDNCAECDIIRPIIERALASLKSSEVAK